MAHDPDLGQALRQVHEHLADTLAGLLRRGQAAGDVRDDIDPHTAAWWLVSLLAGRSFRAAVVQDHDTVEAELTRMALESLRPRRPESPRGA
ncbi:SbtR family transcriptional regulator [Streptomyces sp. NPDC001709]